MTARQSAKCNATAYTRFRRLRRVFWFFEEMTKHGPLEFERTQSKHIALTNGLETETVKRIKAKFRRELGGGGEGK